MARVREGVSESTRDAMTSMFLRVACTANLASGKDGKVHHLAEKPAFPISFRREVVNQLCRLLFQADFRFVLVSLKYKKYKDRLYIFTRCGVAVFPWVAPVQISASLAAVERLDTLQNIELSEGVAIRLRPAGPLLRGAAWFIDTVVLVVVLFCIAVLFKVFSVAIGGIAIGTLLIAVFFIYWGYHIIFEMTRWSGSLGKRITGLRVVQTSGAPLTLTHSIIRNLVRLADFLPVGPGILSFFIVCPIGLVTCLLTRRFQRLGDLAAGTVVVYRDPPERALPPPITRETVVPPVVLSREEQAAFADFQERFSQWSLERRVEMVSHLEPMSHKTGEEGIEQALGISAWLQDPDRAAS